MKATPCLCTQIYGVEIGGTDRERKVEGGRDRSEGVRAASLGRSRSVGGGREVI